MSKGGILHGMVRSAPSEADVALIQGLASEGYSVSPSQLERWRFHGLVPRSVVLRARFGGSSVTPHRPEIFEACRVLAQCSGRGQSWQMSAESLFDEGLPLSTPAVRGAVLWSFERQMRGMRRAWRHASAGIEVDDLDTEVWVPQVAAAAGKYLGREFQALMRDEVATAHPNLGSRRLAPLVEEATKWRVADVCVPELLNDRQRALARTGSVEPLDLVDGTVIALPSERLACLETVTWAEMSCARLVLIARESSALEIMSALDAASWWVTAMRLGTDFNKPELPLTHGDLQSELDALKDLPIPMLDQEPLPGMADLA